jgi:NAD(P)-dependent dehydrogenase (short-subunit alcohol dehydrogenase family)
VRDLAGKVAVVTGGASGIGLAMARRFAAEQMRVVLADIEKPALDRATEDLASAGAEVVGIVTDVAEHASVVGLHDAVLDRFGAVHVVCNNAGVVGGSVAKSPIEFWEWVVGVNLFGVVNGCNVFLPTLMAQDEGHVVNTASMAGLQGVGVLGIYCTTKFAVVGLSESLAQELAGSGSRVGVSVVCPGFVQTKIAHSARNMPDRVRSVHEDDDGKALSPLVDSGIPPEQVADAVLDAVTEGRLYVITHPDMLRAAWDQRAALLFGEH